MNNRYKQISFSVVIFISLISLILIPAEIYSLEESLIVSIIDADYPPNAGIREGRNFTIYEIDLVYQVENPTGEDVRVDYTCAPFPFPYLRTSLENTSIVVNLFWIIEWVAGSTVIPPGIRNETFPFDIIVDDYKEETLPVGEYSLWFDFTNCSIVPVPVIIEKLIINVTDNNVTYFFEYDNREDFYTFETTNYVAYSACTIVIVAIIVRNKKKGNA